MIEKINKDGIMCQYEGIPVEAPIPLSEFSLSKIKLQEGETLIIGYPVDEEGYSSKFTIDKLKQTLQMVQELFPDNTIIITPNSLTYGKIGAEYNGKFH